jgi:hypothetical protein
MILEFEGVGNYKLITASTIERDIAISNVLRSSGAHDAMLQALTAGEEPDRRIFEAISGSGKLFELLGASLVPEGVDPLTWTPAMARDTAQALKNISAPKAKQLLLLSVVELVKAFFLAELHSLVISRSSSPKATGNGAAVGPDGENAATSNSATGH